MAKNKKVLIVDDDKGFLEELEENLSLSGYDMVAVNDPVSFLPIALREKPDIVLLDLKMPGKSGFQLADEMSRLFELQNVPIIAMSAYFKDEYRMLMNVCGIKKCLKKPFNPLDVISEIEGALAEKQF
ncbi:MAG: response regulator [Candidatus Omnitrophota bacterium]|nr:response regulator [Candidatus Omnitrophota bacterium]